MGDDNEQRPAHELPDICPIVPRPKDRDRYVALGTTDDQVVIFDREHDSAWFKSSHAMGLEDMA